MVIALCAGILVVDLGQLKKQVEEELGSDVVVITKTEHDRHAAPSAACLFQGCSHFIIPCGVIKPKW